MSSEREPATGIEPDHENDEGPESLERVRVVGGPLNGNRYVMAVRVGASVGLKSLQGTAIYRFASFDDGEPHLRYVGPAAPLV